MTGLTLERKADIGRETLLPEAGFCDWRCGYRAITIEMWPSL